MKGEQLWRQNKKLCMMYQEERRGHIRKYKLFYI